MTRHLLLLTNAYPYGVSETFVAHEMPALAAGFDHVTVLATQVPATATTLRAVPPGVDVIAVPEPSGRVRRAALFAAGVARSLATGSARRLLAWSGGLRSLRYEAAFEARAHSAFARIVGRLPALDLRPGDEVTVYAYWFHHAARVGELVAVWLRRHHPDVMVRCVSRAHGYDVFEDRHPTGRLPQREALLRAYDAVYPVSEAGAQHLRERHPAASQHVAVRHLGTPEPDPRPALARDRLYVTSCAFVTPVKRLERLVPILARVVEAGVPVTWTHLGSGPGLPALRAAASRVAGLDAKLLGHVEAEAIFDTYAQHPSTVFVSVSSSEGVPVSMMEAISGGIPVVSTDVGGVRDLVVPGVTGFLVAGDLDDDEVADALIRVWRLPEHEYRALSESCRAHWEQEFSAASNYQRFVLRDLAVRR